MHTDTSTQTQHTHIHLTSLVVVGSVTVSMAVLCSSSCCSRPLLQGMLLLAVLLLASIQAGPVMAALDAQEVQAFGDMFHKAFDYGGKKLATEVSSRPGMERFGKGLKTGFTVGKALFSLSKILQNFSDSPSRRIFRRMHGVLNIDKNKN